MCQTCRKDRALDIAILFSAGLLAGILNTLAGGGSFVIFPAMLFVGVPPIMANATNTFACMPGYGSGAFGFRKDILRHSDKLPLYACIALVAGYLGAETLLIVPDAQFSAIIPWLMAFALLAFTFGARLNTWLNERFADSGRTPRGGAIVLAVLLASICFYGGFFNAGLGIILLAFLVVAGYKDLNAMNGLKLLISFLVSITAVVRFLFAGSIDLVPGIAALIGATLGGYAATRIAYLLSQRILRGFVIGYGIVLTGYFFYAQYWA